MNNTLLPNQSNVVAHKNSDGTYMCYVDGMFGACVTADSVEEAIPLLRDTIEKQLEYFEELEIPAFIGSDELPQEDQVILRLEILENDWLKEAASEAIERNITINSLMCELIEQALADKANEQNAQNKGNHQ